MLIDSMPTPEHNTMDWFVHLSIQLDVIWSFSRDGSTLIDSVIHDGSTYNRLAMKMMQYSHSSRLRLYTVCPGTLNCTCCLHHICYRLPFFRCAKRIESVSLFVIDWVAFLVSVLCRLNLIYGKPSASAGERRYPSSNSIQAVWTDRSIAGRLAIDRNDITAYQYPLKIISKQSVSKRSQQPSGCISSNVTIMQSMVHSLGCF